MTGVLLDTHAWIWSLTDDPRLSAPGRRAIDAAEAVYVSPISFFEVGQKVRIGKWPEMAAHAAALPDLLRQQGGLIATMSPEISLLAAMMDWAHRDPFDRILAATALVMSVRLISADTVFNDLPAEAGAIEVIW